MNELEKKLKKKLLELDRVSLNDRPIDPPIKKVVAFMNLLGFPTFFSCGGHCGKKKIVIPYVMGQANKKPLYSYIGEKNLIKKIAKKHKVNFDDVFYLGRIQTNYEKDFWFEVLRLRMQKTSQYKLWTKKNTVLTRNLEKFVKSFNKHRKNIPNEFRLYVEKMGECFRLQFKGEDKWFDKLTKTGYRSSDQSYCQRRLIILRREIKAFEDFLEINFKGKKN